MIRRRFGGFNSKDRYIDELLANQEKELAELRKEPREREQEQQENPYSYEDPLTKQETRRVMLSATIAGLAIGLIFIGAMFLFLLFCINVWFA